MSAIFSIKKERPTDTSGHLVTQHFTYRRDDTNINGKSIELMGFASQDVI
jgi:hypothetical protein